MAVTIVEGDLLDAFDRGEVTDIGHCVNCQGCFGSGIARSIKERYPECFEVYIDDVGYKLGDSQCVEIAENKFIFNLFGQEFYGRCKRQLNYGAMAAALNEMSDNTSVDDKVGFPYKMGCDRAGGDWEVVLEMIEYYFRSHKDVKIYKLV
jgi:O-acetyl-ADP-ribose deacetylase (regulator of RNase III)